VGRREIIPLSPGEKETEGKEDTGKCRSKAAGLQLSLLIPDSDMFNICLRGVFVLIMLPAAVLSGTAGGLIEIFEPLFGVEWTGHYQNSEDSSLTHIIKFDPILDGTAVRETKKVPEANFIKETQIFRDEQEGRYSFLTLTNRGGSNSGKFYAEDGKIVYEGMDIQRGRTFKFRITFEITPDGNLHDCFYTLQGDEWVQGHFIIYTSEPDNTEN